MKIRSSFHMNYEQSQKVHKYNWTCWEVRRTVQFHRSANWHNTVHDSTQKHHLNLNKTWSKMPTIMKLMLPRCKIADNMTNILQQQTTANKHQNIPQQSPYLNSLFRIHSAQYNVWVTCKDYTMTTDDVNNNDHKNLTSKYRMVRWVSEWV